MPGKYDRSQSMIVGLVHGLVHERDRLVTGSLFVRPAGKQRASERWPHPTACGTCWARHRATGRSVGSVGVLVEEPLDLSRGSHAAVDSRVREEP